MKTLILIRHAKAVDRSLAIPDYERYLIKPGKKETKMIATKFKELEIHPDVFISSPAKRALETAQIFGEELGYSEEKIKIEDKLYHASSGISFVDILKELSDNINTVLLFGHEPTLSDVACFLLKNFQGDIPKSGIVGIDFNVKTWKNIEPAKAHQKFVLYPKKTLNLKEIRKGELKTRLSNQIKKYFSNIDAGVAEEMKGQLYKASDKLIDKFFKKLKKRAK